MHNFKSIPKKELIKKIKEDVKKEKAVIDILKKYNLDKNIIDDVIIKFEPLDVSAKTVNGVIILNEKLLFADWRDIIRYVSHELTHVGQQNTSDITETQGNDYLDDPNEVEAFQTQLDVMEEMYNPEEIQEYLDGLMNHHNINGKERKEKIKELLK